MASFNALLQQRTRRADPRQLILVAGVLAGILLPVIAGEAYLRVELPADIEPYRGAAADLSGPYRADPDTGVTYRSFEGFRERYGERLDELGPLDSSARGPVWAMFGNSFVQMRGALGDTAAVVLPNRHLVYLRKNQPIPVRLAEMRLLLEHGLTPERIFFVLIDYDLETQARQPHTSIRVTPQGGLGFAPAPAPGPLGALVEHSRLALAAWVRSGEHRYPVWRPAWKDHRQLSESALAEWRHILGFLADIQRRYSAPITVVLVTGRYQAQARRDFDPQDALTPLILDAGLDVFDVRGDFLRQPDKSALYLPDAHLSRLGNRVLLGGLIEHLRGLGEPIEDPIWANQP